MKWLHVFPPTHRLCYHSQVRGLIFIYVFTYSVFIYLFTLWYNPFVRICFNIDIYYCFIALFSSGLRSFTLCVLISSFIILLEQATSTPSESNVPYALYNNLLFFFFLSPLLLSFSRRFPPPLLLPRPSCYRHTFIMTFAHEGSRLAASIFAMTSAFPGHSRERGSQRTRTWKNTTKNLKSLQTPHFFGALSAAWCPQGRVWSENKIKVLTNVGTLAVWETPAGKKEWKKDQESFAFDSSLAFSPYFLFTYIPFFFFF